MSWGLIVTNTPQPASPSPDTPHQPDQHAAQALASVIATHEWQPTSRWTLLKLFGNLVGVFVIYFFYQISKIGISIGVPPEIVEQIQRIIPWFNETIAIGLLELAVPVLIALTPFIQWLSLRWRLDEQTIELRQGILWRKHQKMARSRVQTVTITADIVGRLTNTRSVVISSGDTEDIIISLVRLEMAEQLRVAIAPHLRTANQPEATYVRDALRETVVGQVASATHHTSQEPQGASVETLLGIDAAAGDGKRIDIVRMGAFDWIKFVVLTCAPHALITLACAIPVALVAVFVIARAGGAISGFAAASSIPIILLALIPVAFGISMNQINDWGFTAWIQDGRIHSVQGLISRFEKGASLARLQTVSVNQNPLRLWLKLDEVTITTADAAFNTDNTDAILKLVHPMLPAGQWEQLAEQLLGVQIPDTLNPPSRKTIYRGIVRTLQIGLPCAAIAGATEYGLVGSYWSGVVLLALTLIAAFPVGLWRYHNLRWAINETCFVIRRGLVFRHITTVPLNLVQNVFADATFFQRRLGLGDVDADVAGLNAPKVRAHDLAASDADRVEAILVAHANQAASKDGV